MMMVMMEVQDTKAEAIAAPIKPNLATKGKVNIQVSEVHIIMSFRVILILPIALMALVRGVEMDDHMTLMINRCRAGRAGCHF